jgi:uncharacterized OB-fold protein
MTDPARISPLATYLRYLERGELAYQYSLDAQKPVFYPRVVCPYTGSENLEWRISKGVGTVYATTYVQPREGPAYNVSLIDMDEGFRLMSRVDSIPAQDIRIGMRVAVRIHEKLGDEPPYPVFVPVDRVL